MQETKSTDLHVSRADMHVHSTASELSKLGIQRSLQLRDGATGAEEVYSSQAFAHGFRDDPPIRHRSPRSADRAPAGCVSWSEELTVWFRGEPTAVHVSATDHARDHEWLQAHNDSGESCAEYLNDR